LYLGRLGIRDLADMMARARSEALASLDIDPGEATAHAVLGAIAASYEYDWDKAGARFQSAMASTVVEPAVDDLFALCYLVPLGRFETAKRHIEQAIARDPLNLLWRERRLTILASSGRYEEAIGEARKVLEFNSNSFLAHFTIAGSYLTLGNLRDARSTAEEAYRLAPWHPAAAGLFAGLLERAGDHERAAPLVASIEKANRPIAMLNYYVASGHVDAAVDCFVEALEQRELIASQLVRADFLKPLHSSPRWAVVLKTMNLDADRQPLMP
jgi:tetratricopeptide (TPR) repeat protein